MRRSGPPFNSVAIFTLVHALVACTFGGCASAPWQHNSSATVEADRPPLQSAVVAPASTPGSARGSCSSSAAGCEFQSRNISDWSTAQIQLGSMPNSLQLSLAASPSELAPPLLSGTTFDPTYANGYFAGLRSIVYFSQCGASRR